MANSEGSIVRNYFNVSHALQELAGTNSKGLLQKELEYMLAIGTYQEVRFTERQLKEVFGESASSVNDSVKVLTDLGMVEKEPSDTRGIRGAKVKLTPAGEQVYRVLNEGLAKAVDEDFISKRRAAF